MNVAEVNTSKIIAMLLIVAISFFTNLRVICRPQIGDLLFNSISLAPWFCCVLYFKFLKQWL